MARKVVEKFYSDLSGDEAEGTITFAFMGANYEIDLTDDEREEFSETLQKYISAGRRTGGRLKRGNAGARAAMDREQMNAMREWGRQNGYKVSDRGRLSRELVDAYHAEH